MDKLLCGRRTLVVEYEMLIVMMIEDMLADLGCKSVTSAATVDKALALIEAQTFDVALLDMNLNGDDSYPVAKALLARGVPFAYSTGNTGQSVRDSNSDRVVLKKPFKLEDLVAILTRLKLRRSSERLDDCQVAVGVDHLAVADRQSAPGRSRT
ncbi:response regulator [Bradyrhizobium japonicum]|uniref:response regulator n=1 Tax=Bradyrhizobium japonicum TaxID=375 RepID=UPI0009B69467|nr:response regulator [Bradyrhizobium japonicum]